MGAIWTLVLNGGLGLAAYRVARFGFRQPSGWPRILCAALVAWAWLTVGMEFLGTLGFLSRWPLLGWVGLGLAIGELLRVMRTEKREAAAPKAPARSWSWEEVVSVALLLWGSVLVGAQSLLLPVKVLTDGPIYHLYFAARWWKAGRLELIALPFGENAATYFPAVGDLWFAWLMIGWGGDRLARVGQAPFLALAGLTVFALCQRLGAGRSAAAVATAWFLTCSPFFIISFESNVDTILVAGYLLAAYFFVRYAMGDDGRASLALAALGAGGTLATKAPGIVFVPPLLLLGAALAAWRSRGIRDKVLGVLTVLIVPLVFAGFWWGRCWLLTGNPLYPLHLSAFGRVWLAGWYGPDVMRLSQYYIPFGDWRAFGDIATTVVDPRLAPVWLAAIAGAWAIGRSGRSPVDRWVWFASALAVFNVALYWVVIPYRTQYRFMYHAMGLAAVPLARTLDRGRFVRALGVVLLGIHMLTFPGWPIDSRHAPIDFHPDVPNNLPPPIYTLPTTVKDLRAIASAPWRLVGALMVLTMGGAALLTAWTWSRAAEEPTRPRRLKAAIATVLLLGITIGAFYPRGENERQTFYPPFADFYRGWLAMDLRSGAGGVRLAYAGTDIPYYLMAAGLRNEVRYINVDAHRHWLLHDYHLAALRDAAEPRLWPNPRPGWDRIHPDYDAWLSNLRAEEIQLLVVTRVNPQNGPHNVATAENFPIERVWADAHPEVFEPVYGLDPPDPWFRLYRLKTANETVIGSADR